MLHRLSYILLICFLAGSASGQYPATGNKSRLGWQTTADGLVWRGAIGDTATIDPVGLLQAWALVDTASGVLYQYRGKAWRPVLAYAIQPFDSIVFNDNQEDADSAELKYNADIGSLVYGANDGAQIPVLPGHWYVRNDTSVTLTKGTLVRAVGTIGASGRIKVRHMIGDNSISAEYVMGIVVKDIPAGEDGYIMFYGKIRKLNTNAFNEGDLLYPDDFTPGALTNAPVYFKTPIAFVVHKSINQGVIAVRIQTENYLSRLHDVTLPGLAAQNILRYSGQYWIPGRDTSIYDFDARLKGNRTVLMNNFDVKFRNQYSENNYVQIRPTFVMVRDSATGEQATLNKYGIAGPVTGGYLSEVRLANGVYLNGSNSRFVEGLDTGDGYDVTIDTVGRVRFRVSATGTADSLYGKTSSGLLTAIKPNYLAYTDTASMLSTYINASDTAAMLLRYVNFADTAAMLSTYLKAKDTTSLSNRINLKLNIADTASMLANYINAVDTAAMLLPYLRKADTLSMLSTYINAADTAAMLDTYINRADTAAMLSTYINAADTAAMLSAYINASDTAAMLTNYINAVDTAAMLSTYINREDTATMLTNYVNFVDTLTTIGTKANLALKLNAADTASLSNRINLKLSIADTASMLSTYLRPSEILAGTGITLVKDSTVTISAPTTLSSATENKGIAEVVVDDLSTLRLPWDGTAVVGILTDYLYFFVNVNGQSSQHPLIPDGGKGDITTTKGGAVMTIDAGAVSLAKLSSGVRDTLAGKLNIADTLSMLSTYINREDTAAMLIPYINREDTAAMLTNYVNFVDTLTTIGTKANLNLKLNAADTASLSSRIDLKLNAADTASLSTRIDARVRYTDTTSLIATKANLTLKLNAADTASLSNRINLKLNAADTVKYVKYIDTLTTIGTKANLALKLNAADTASLSTRIDARVRYTDTTSLIATKANLTLKLNAADTASLSTRIDAKQNTITGAATSITTANLTASRALVSDSGGKVAASTVTATELGYLSGVTSAIQTQLNGKQNTLTNPVTGTGTANELPFWNGTNAIGTLTTAIYPNLTELSYVKGVTSAIQTQLNGKQNTLTNPVTGTGTANELPFWNGTNAIGTLTTAIYPNLTELSYVKGVTSAIQTQLDGKLSSAAGAVGETNLANGSVTGAKLGSMTSANLSGALTDETGSGASGVAVFANSPTLNTSVIINNGTTGGASGSLILQAEGASQWSLTTLNALSSRNFLIYNSNEFSARPFSISKTGSLVGIGNDSPVRQLHVTGEARITDLTTDTPTRIVGADADGDLGEVTIGTGLTISGGALQLQNTTFATVTGATYTVANGVKYIICNRAGTITITLPTASTWSGREIMVKTIQAQTVISAASNVAPIDDTAAGTAILPATDGAWALLVSDGTNWIIMQKGQ